MRKWQVIAVTMDVRDAMALLQIKYKQKLARNNSKKQRAKNFAALILCAIVEASNRIEEIRWNGSTRGNAMEMDIQNGSLYTFS